MASFALTLYHYGNIPFEGNPSLGASDDRDYFAQAANGFSWDDVFKAYDDHIAPVIRLIYFSFWRLAGSEWEPWGWFALLGHATYCALAGLVVLRFGGALVPALAVTAPLVVSVPLSSALRFHFAPALVTWMMVLILGSVLLVACYIETGSRVALGALLLAITTAVFFATQAVIIVPIVVTFHGLLRLGGSRGGGAWRLDHRDRAVLWGLVSVAVLYAIVLAVGFVFWQNRLPTTSPVRPPSSTGVGVRLVQLLGYALVEWIYPFRHGGGLDETPPSVATYGGSLMAILAALAASFALLMWRASERRSRIGGAAGMASIVAAVLFATMVVVGRPSTPLSSMRYNCVAVVFLAVAVGLSFSLASRRMSPTAVTWCYALVVLLAYYSTSVNAWYAVVNHLNRISG